MTMICPDKTISRVHLQQPFHILRLSSAGGATSNYFCLPLYYEDHSIVMNVSLDAANINAIKMSSLNFRIWQHFSRNWTKPHLQKLIKDHDENSSFMWTILKHPGTHIRTIL